MSTNKFSKYVIDNIVVGTPISSIVAAGATIGLDSAAVTALIDSDYVQQRETSGLDSAEVIALIDSDYVSARTPAANGGGLDSAAALDLFAYGIEEVGANQRQVAISLNTFVDPFNQTTNTDRTFNLNYTSTTGMFIRETGGRTEIHADASGTGQSTGLLLSGSTFGNNGTEIVGNLKLPNLPTTDPAETGLLWNDGGIPVFSGSTAPIGGAGLDSAAVEGIVDSAYVQARQTPQDFAYSSLTGAPTTLSSFTNDTNYITAADIPATVDSDYVQARVTLDGVGLDSAGVTALVDSDYVSARAPAGGGLDSAEVLATVNEEFKISVGKVEIGQTALASGSSGIAIGSNAFAQGSFSTALGQNAQSYGQNSLTIGYGAGNTTGGDNAVLIGTNAGQSAHQRLNVVAVGMNAQLTNDANVSATVAVGYDAGKTRQESSTVAIGYKAGETDQLNSATAVGYQAGNTSQGGSSVAIGRDAAFTGQATNSVAIGRAAGYENQGTRSIAIGRQAGALNQGDNNIILNATSAALDRTDQFGIDIRTSAAGSLTYDTTNDWTFGAGVTMTDLTASGVVIFSALPTSDPVNAGQLWNDAGTLKVSAG